MKNKLPDDTPPAPYHPNLPFRHIPGVCYPQIRPGYDPKTGTPYNQKPAWGISSAEAAYILHCTTAAARHCLARQNVTFRLVRPVKSALQKYWHRAQVEQIAATKHPIYRNTPAHIISAQDAMKALGVSRTTLKRYEEQRMLSSIPLRRRTHLGLRAFHYYKRRDVEFLAHARQLWLQRSTPSTTLRHIWQRLKHKTPKKD